MDLITPTHHGVLSRKYSFFNKFKRHSRQKFPKTYALLVVLTCLLIPDLYSQVVVNEVITDPQQNWSSGGFTDPTPGGTAGSDDEWIELYISVGGLDLTGWTITVDDGVPFSGDLTNTGAFDVVNYIGSGSLSNTVAGDYIILGNPDGGNEINNSGVTITLEDDNTPTPNIIDQIFIDGASGTMFTGNASGVDDESVARIPNGQDTDVEADDFVLTRATLGTSNSPSGIVLINEVVTDPQQDWEGGGFTSTPGGGGASGTDEWIELYIGTSGLNLTKWTIRVDDGGVFSGDLTSSGAFQVVNYVGSGSFVNTQVGDYVVLGNPTGSEEMNNSVFIELFHPDGSLVDDVEIGDDDEGDGNGDGAPDGAASGGDANSIDDESVARIANGTDTDNDINDFQQVRSTIGSENGLVNVFVDAAATDDSGLGTVGNPKQLIQSGIDLVLSAGTVTVAGGNYTENLTISKPLTINGANQGVAGNAIRGTESRVDPGTLSTALTISSDDVTIDGIQIGTDGSTSNATGGILASISSTIAVTNNIIYANSTGISISGSATGTVDISDNLVSMLAVEDATNATNGSVGIALSNISGDTDANITGNDISNAGIGISTYALTSSVEAIIDGGTYTGCTAGIIPLNTDGMGGFSPSMLTIQNVTMSGFVTDTDVVNPDTEVGVYVVSAGGTGVDDLTITMDNLDISGVGNGAATGASNNSGIIIGDFPSASNGAGINAAITNCNIHDNENRGIYTRGADAVTNITQTSITGNGFNPHASGGNFGFSIIGREGSITTVSNCFITNPATLSAPEDIGAGYYVSGLHISTGGSLTVSDCSLDNNGNGFIAETSGIDLSGNYFGTTDEPTIHARVGASNDFTPWLALSTDTEGGTAGFQGDFSDLIVGVSGSQTGVSGRVEEGISLVDASGTVTVNAGTYPESLTISKSLTLNGANQGVAGSGTRTAESIIEPSSTSVGIIVSTNDLTIDGFQFGTDNTSSNHSTAISNTGFSGFTAANNVIYSNSSGIGLSSVTSGTITLSNNAIEMLNLEDPLTATNPSVGVFVSNVSGSADVDISGNDVSNASFGIFGFALTSSTDLVIDGGNISDCTKGIEVDNADGTGNYSPSTVTIQNVTMMDFIGPDADVLAPDAQAGIYLGVFSTLGSGSATDADDISASISNVNISGVGNTANDYSGIYVADFNSGEPSTGTSDLISIDVSISNSIVSDNLNRGVYTRGANATTTISNSTLSDNGSNPASIGSALVVFASGSINISNSFLVNPGSSTGTVSTLLAQQNGVITAQNNSFDQNTNGDLADIQTGGTVDMSGNWLGETDQTIIEGFMDLTGVDFTPWLGSGTDTDGGTPGFQPDLSSLFVGTSGTQTLGERIQEGHDLIDADGTITIIQDNYAETLTVSKNVSLNPESGTTIDNITLGDTLFILTNLEINNTLDISTGFLDIDLDDGDKSDDPTLTLNNAVLGTFSDANHIEGKIETAIAAAGSFTFPVGDAGAYRPAILNPTNATTFLVSHVAETTAGDIETDLVGVTSTQLTGDIESTLNFRYWDLDVVTGTPGNTDVTLEITSGDNASDPGTLGMARFDGANWSEIVLVGAGGSDPYTITGRTSSFSDFTIYTTDNVANPLPVELLGFKGEYRDSNIQLFWSTLTEVNAELFQIERREILEDDFQTIGSVAAHGNANERKDYSYLDKNVEGAYYYRLKMVDYDGTYEYSEIVLVADELNQQKVLLYPNPVREEVYFNGIDPSYIKRIAFYDLNGKPQKMITSPSSSSIDTSALPEGHYLVKIELIEGSLFEGRILKQN